MKTRIFGLLLVIILALPSKTGCQMARNAESAGREVVHSVESAGNSIKQAVTQNVETASGKNTTPALTLEEAQNIALKHAGFAANQVTALHTEYEVEHGIPQYDVEFHHGAWEYDYEIHADTGEILSYSKDD